MNAKETYKDFMVQLQQLYSSSEAATITDWVFEHFLAIKKSDLVKDPALPLSPSAKLQIENALGDLLKHKPIQYVTGEAWFYKMKFNVNEDVLIPRPETEELVEGIIADCNSDSYRKQITDFSILDIGTGSGCIAVSLKKNIPSANITAIDISKGALNIARENALIHGTEIDFIELDFLNESSWSKLPSFDIIVSNPPYIPIAEKAKLDKNVTEYEPGSALFVPDESPLLFYENIASFGKTHLNKGGKIYVEIHEDHAKETAALFKTLYDQVKIKKDLFGKERMLMVS